MKLHPVKVHPSKALLKREDQLAWKMAGVAVDKVAVEKPVQEMIINRIIDNASVAIAAINRRPVVSARGMALGHAKKAGGAQVFGVKSATTVSPVGKMVMWAMVSAGRPDAEARPALPPASAATRSSSTATVGLLSLE